MLRTGEAARAGCNQIGGEFVGTVDQSIGGNDFGHQAEFPGLLRVDDAASQQEVAAALFADLARQENGNNRGKEADLYFGVAKFGFGRREREIAESRNSAASSVSGAVDRCN